jgi:hypothetical protein
MQNRHPPLGLTIPTPVILSSDLGVDVAVPMESLDDEDLQVDNVLIADILSAECDEDGDDGSEAALKVVWNLPVRETFILYLPIYSHSRCQGFPSS